MNFRSIKTLLFLGIFVLALFSVKYISLISETRLTRALSLYGFIALLFYIFFGNRKFAIPVRWNSKVLGLKYIIPIVMLANFFASYMLYSTRGQWALEVPLYFILITAFIQCLGEELIFRGLILNEFCRRWNYKKAAILSSIIFGLMHFASLSGTSDVESVINQVIVAGGLGFFLAAVYIVSRNILLPTVIHFFLNLPSYFKRISVENPSVEEVFPDVSWIEILVSSVMVLLMYSPFFIIGYFLLKKVNQEKMLSDQTLE